MASYACLVNWLNHTTKERATKCANKKNHNLPALAVKVLPCKLQLYQGPLIILNQHLVTHVWRFNDDQVHDTVLCNNEQFKVNMLGLRIAQSFSTV